MCPQEGAAIGKSRKWLRGHWLYFMVLSEEEESILIFSVLNLAQSRADLTPDPKLAEVDGPPWIERRLELYTA